MCLGEFWCSEPQPAAANRCLLSISQLVAGGDVRLQEDVAEAGGWAKLRMLNLERNGLESWKQVGHPASFVAPPSLSVGIGTLGLMLKWHVTHGVACGKGEG